MLEAWKIFVEESNSLKKHVNFQYDLVDITRQVIANYAQVIYANMINSYKNRDIRAFKLESEKFIDLLKEQNLLLNSKKDFMLGPWLESAKLRATNDGEKDLFEYNARAQITTWSFQDSDLHDYAHREWGGLLSDFYLPRWEMFIANLLSDLKGDSPKAADYYSFESEWCKEQKVYPTKEQGNCVSIANQLFEKYYHEILGAYVMIE